MAHVAQICAESFDGQQLQALTQEIFRKQAQQGKDAEAQRSEDYTSGRLSMLEQRKKRARVCLKLSQPQQSAHRSMVHSCVMAILPCW